MKKIYFLSILMVFSFGFFENCYAISQHYTTITNSTQQIYFIFPQLTPFIKKINDRDYALIKTTTCKFSTYYNGTISFNLFGVKDTCIKETITQNTPLIYKFEGYVSYSEGNSPEVGIYNLGCNSGTDGDACIIAKQQKIDALIIDCY